MPGSHIDDFLQELYYLLSSASVPASKGLVHEILECHSLEIEEAVITEITTAVCSCTQVPRAIKKMALLALPINVNNITSKNSVLLSHLPMYFIVKSKKTFQYVPLLKSLQQILNCKVVLDKVLQNHRGLQDIEPVPSFELRSPQDSLYFKENSFLNTEELRILLRLYVDDFETCNPLGTSRKKHKLCGVY